ncbi:MAG: class I SAM-dependent methyltransferase [Deltaproteobacteria bacterium]|nr:class I SAM-dependent methyltransferase [Deltaproteobacteria bacterium]
MGVDEITGPREFYDRLAPVYQELYAYPPVMTLRQVVWLERHAPPGPLLDLGCGPGRILPHLARGGRWAVGLDFSPNMLTLARQALPEASLVRADAARPLPFLDASFVAVISLHATLIHLADFGDLCQLSREVARVLRPGGLFLVELPHPRTFPRTSELGVWRTFRPGIRCRRMASKIEEMCLDEVGGLCTRVRILDLDDLDEWLSPFARVDLHPGFTGGRFNPKRGLSMVVAAWL